MNKKKKEISKMAKLTLKLRSSEKPQFPFFLPLEMWLNILSYFTPLDIIYLGQISSVFRRLSREDIVWDASLKQLWIEHSILGVFYQVGRLPSDIIPIKFMDIVSIFNVIEELPKCYDGSLRMNYYCYPAISAGCTSCDVIGYRISPFAFNNFNSIELTAWLYMMTTNAIYMTKHIESCYYHKFTSSELNKKSLDAENMCYVVLDHWSDFVNHYTNDNDSVLYTSPCNATITRIFAQMSLSSPRSYKSTPMMNCGPDINNFFKKYKRKRKFSDNDDEIFVRLRMGDFKNT